MFNDIHIVHVFGKLVIQGCSQIDVYWISINCYLQFFHVLGECIPIDAVHSFKTKDYTKLVRSSVFA